MSLSTHARSAKILCEAVEKMEEMIWQSWKTRLDIMVNVSE